MHLTYNPVSGYELHSRIPILKAAELGGGPGLRLTRAVLSGGPQAISNKS